ncbi:MAG: hypothetical protein JWM33_4010, partial [Caulobacteraceae bacterium]|nr:hypothetical protein [Caulobacteraceae bacterium]
MIVEPIIVAALAGGAAAQLAGPLSLGWPGRAGELVARIAALASRRPSRRAKAIGAAVIGVVLVGGGLAAYAAMPAAPRRIIVRAAQAAGLGVRDAFLGDRVSPTLAPVSVEQATLDP